MEKNDILDNLCCAKSVDKMQDCMIEFVYDKIVSQMDKDNIMVYSFINNEEKPTLLADNGKHNIVALCYDGYSLGVMIENELTPIRREFLIKKAEYLNDDETIREIAKLSDDTSGFDSFILLVDSALYPIDTLFSILKYIEKLKK